MLLSGWRFGCAKQRHPKEMTTREALIIRIICQGISQKHIAMKLYVSEKTVGIHKLNALHKLKIKNVAIFLMSIRPSIVYGCTQQRDTLHAQH